MNTTPFLKTKTFSDICRVCLKTGNLFMIDEVDWESSQLKKVLGQWIFFDKIGEKILPQKVCKSCIKWAYNTDYLLKQIQRNQEILQYSVSYELSQAQEKENQLEEKPKKENMIVFEMRFKETNEELTVNYYCEADNLSVVEEINEDYDESKDNISVFSNISSLKSNTDNSSPQNSALDLKFKDETVDYYINEIASEKAIAFTSSFESNAANKEPVLKAVKTESDTAVIAQQEAKVNSQLHLECFNYFCGACEHGFKTDEELMLHKKLIKSHIFGGCIFICHPCKYKTKVRLRFQVHMDKHQNIKSHQCSTCGKAFRAPGDLKRHNNNIHLNLRKFKCKFCYKLFIKKEFCDEHEKSHKDILYVCSFCGSSFTVWMKWFTHERSHKQAQKLNLTSEIRTRAPGNTKPIQTPCDLCKEIFPSRAQMVSHRICVHNKNDFVCQTCGHKVKTIESFEVHMNSHKNLRMSHQCKYCKKSFFNAKWYKKHLKLHTDESQHKCPHCTKPCIDKRALTTHLRVHTGEKSQKCTHCPKVFASSQNLKFHLKTHAGPPTLKCLLCPRAFYINYMLQRHLRKKHQSIMHHKN